MDGKSVSGDGSFSISGSIWPFLLDSDSGNELQMELEEAFSERGVPLRYPTTGSN